MRSWLLLLGVLALAQARTPALERRAAWEKPQAAAEGEEEVRPAARALTASTCADGGSWVGDVNCATCQNTTYCLTCAAGFAPSAANASVCATEASDDDGGDYDLGGWILVIVITWVVILVVLGISYLRDYRRAQKAADVLGGGGGSSSFKVAPAADSTESGPARAQPQQSAAAGASATPVVEPDVAVIALP